MSVKTSNPQPQAVERINKQNSNKSQSNLDGNEINKSSQEKKKMIKNRNKNNEQ